MKKLVLIIMVLCMIATLGIATAQAGWYTCRIVQTGATSVGTAGIYIKLTDTAGSPAFTARWFRLDPTYGNQHLAAALTTLSAGLTCDAYFPVAGVPSQYALITALYVNTQ
jgi:hypothetical protein